MAEANADDLCNDCVVQTVSVVDGTDPIRFSTDVSFDIETAPIQEDADDGALLSLLMHVVRYCDSGKDCQRNANHIANRPNLASARNSPENNDKWKHCGRKLARYRH
ncbi:MAG TPA: hypothetical protein VFE46_09845 [Pirellulales bacterium]|jgi:hypothetical protein|nr:hypothetical protein [Pirellulales bacterium]